MGCRDRKKITETSSVIVPLITDAWFSLLKAHSQNKPQWNIYLTIAEV